MKMKLLGVILLLSTGFVNFSGELYAQAQEREVPLCTLDSCRSMALMHNKEIQIARLAIDKASYEHRSARANYFPKIDVAAGFAHLGGEISLLSTTQQSRLANVGTELMNGIAPKLQEMAKGLLMAHPELAPLLQSSMAKAPEVAQRLNQAGQQLTNAFDVDASNVGVGAIILTQPLYMGGKIRAYDRITHYSEQLAGERLRAEQQEVLLEVDRAYWQVVSLVNKRRLATAYRDMLVRLHSDVEKMITQGVATRVNELAVSVELNKAEMTLTKVDDGVTLSRMLLAQLCGWELSSQPKLADEMLEDLFVETQVIRADVQQAFLARPELKQLDIAQSIYQEKIKLERSALLPTAALTAALFTHYPSLKNGFENKFQGSWSVGAMVKFPLWHWGEHRHKVRAAQAEWKMAQLRKAEAEEKIALQVNQTAFAMNEATKKLALLHKNLEKAEENLRMSQVGYGEGIIPTSELLAAQTAWLAAQSDKIDAQIDIKLAQASYKKALGK